MGRNGKKSVKARVGKILQAMGRAEGEWEDEDQDRQNQSEPQPPPSGVSTRTVRNFVRDASVTCSTLIFHPRYYKRDYLQCQRDVTISEEFRERPSTVVLNVAHPASMRIPPNGVIGPRKRNLDHSWV